VNQDDKRQMENFLLKQDWPTLDVDGSPSGDLLLFFASILNEHKPYENRHGEWIDQHKMMRDLVNECEPARRQQLYGDLKAHLNFKLLPLSTYEDMIAEKAGKLISQRRMNVVGEAPAIQIGGHVVPVVEKEKSTAVAVMLRCHLCHFKDNIIGETHVTAMINARKAGWVRDKALNKETCPACAVKRASEEVVTLSRKENLIITDHRRVN
jgi:hypothetical protein